MLLHTNASLHRSVCYVCNIHTYVTICACIPLNSRTHAVLCDIEETVHKGHYNATKWINLNFVSEVFEFEFYSVIFVTTDVCHIHNNHTQGNMMHSNVSLCGRFFDRVSGISNVSDLLV